MSCPAGTCTASHLFHKIITALLELFRKMNPLYKNARIIHTGSAYEKTLVGDKIEFDVQIGLKMSDFTIVPAGTPGRYFLKVKSDAAAKYAKLLDGKYLSPSKFYNKVHGDFQKCINQDSFMKAAILPRYHGPATQIDVSNDDHFVFCADIVPTAIVKSGNGTSRLFVPKADTSGTVSAQSDGSWRESFSPQEIDKMRHMGGSSNGTVKALVRSTKAITKADASLNKMNSFIIKNLAYHYNDKNDIPDWRRQNLQEHTKSFLKYASITLKEGELNMYFNEDVNLYKDMKPATMTQMANRLDRLSQNDQERNKIISTCNRNWDENNKNNLRELHDMKVEHNKAGKISVNLGVSVWARPK